MAELGEKIASLENFVLSTDTFFDETLQKQTTMALITHVDFGTVIERQVLHSPDNFSPVYQLILMAVQDLINTTLEGKPKTHRKEDGKVEVSPAWGKKFGRWYILGEDGKTKIWERRD